jgi:hypothetical protein
MPGASNIKRSECASFVVSMPCPRVMSAQVVVVLRRIRGKSANDNFVTAIGTR